MPASTIKEEMHRWKHGELHSGSKEGPVVPHTKKGQKQALAIWFSEKRRASGKGRERKR
jgi:hypothetical protein